jgi:hypothetical protein
MLSRTERRDLAEIERQLQDDAELTGLAVFFTTLARLDRQARVGPPAAAPLATPAAGARGGAPTRGRNPGALPGAIAWICLVGAGLLIMITCTGAPLTDAAVLLATPIAVLAVLLTIGAGWFGIRWGLSRAHRPVST